MKKEFTVTLINDEVNLLLDMILKGLNSLNDERKQIVKEYSGLTDKGQALRQANSKRYDILNQLFDRLAY